MSASKGPATTTSTNVGIGSVGGSGLTSSASVRSVWNLTPSSGSLLRDDDGLFGPSSHNQSHPEYGGLLGYDYVFGGRLYQSETVTNPSPKESWYIGMSSGSRWMIMQKMFHF